jgi:hypothetical protein
MKKRYAVFIVIFVALSTGCVSAPPGIDYSAFRTSDPHSIIVLRPTNISPEVIAPYSVLAQIVVPIAESGFYVFPVALVDQTFKNNGMTVAQDIHALPLNKLYDIFAADAALYINIEDYGTSYSVISSATVVTVSATLVDLQTGAVLWRNIASASSAEGQENSRGGLAGALIQAALGQIIETISDRSFNIAAISAHRLLSADSQNGLLHGPRSRKYGQPASSEKAN